MSTLWENIRFKWKVMWLIVHLFFVHAIKQKCKFGNYYVWYGIE